MMICSGCKRRMRKCGQKAGDHPGTVVHRGHGLCVTCRQKDRGVPWPAKPKKKPITGDPDPATLQSLSAYLAWRAPFRAKADAQ